MKSYKSGRFVISESNLRKFIRRVIAERDVNIDLLGFSGGLRDDQREYVRGTNLAMNLFAIGDYIVNEGRLSHFFFDAMSKSSHVCKGYEKGSSLILEKNEGSMKEVVEVLDLFWEELLSGGVGTLDYDGEGYEVMSKEISEDDVERVRRSINKDLFVAGSDPEVGLMIYFPRMSDMRENMASGTIHGVEKIESESEWKGHLQWELRHDLFHYMEDVLAKEEEIKGVYENLYRSYDNKRVEEIVVNFPVEGAMGEGGLSSSFKDLDNFASLAPFIRSLGSDGGAKKKFLGMCHKEFEDFSPSDARLMSKYFDDVHRCFDFFSDFIKDKIIIQKSHS